MNPVVSRLNPLKHYLRGDNCDGWDPADQPAAITGDRVFIYKR